MVNKLYSIINRFYSVVINLYIIVNKLFTEKKGNFFNSFTNRYELNKNLKVGYFCTKPEMKLRWAYICPPVHIMWLHPWIKDRIKRHENEEKVIQ